MVLGLVSFLGAAVVGPVVEVAETWTVAVASLGVISLGILSVWRSK